MTQTLVTGAGGFIGGHLVKALLERGHQVRAVDVKRRSDWWQYDIRADNWSSWDLRHYAQCVACCLGIEHVYNLAAFMGGIGTIETHKCDCAMNVLISAQMLKAAYANRVQRFFYSSSACFPAGTRVTTARGSIPIEEIAVGDRVVTADGTLAEVTRTMSRRYQGPLSIVHCPGLPPLCVTPDHRFLTTDGQWIPASSLAGHRLRLPIPNLDAPARRFQMDLHRLIRLRRAVLAGTNEPLYKLAASHGASLGTPYSFSRGHFPSHCDPVTKEIVAQDAALGELVGLFLADGWVESPPHGSKRVLFSFGTEGRKANLVDRVRTLLGATFGIPDKRIRRWDNTRGQKSCKVGICSNLLAQFFLDNCYQSASAQADCYSKCVGEKLFTGPFAFRQQLVRGWWLGDGWIRRSRSGESADSIGIGTASHRLAADMRAILLSLGIQTSVQIMRSRASVLSDRTIRATVDCHNLYTVGSQASRQRACDLCVTNDCPPPPPTDETIHNRCLSVDSFLVDCTVYNLEVKDAPSYTAHGFAVHNCAYAAGKQNHPDVPALKEEDAYPAMPEDGYGWEKLFSERLARHWMEDYGLETRVARFHNSYGPHGSYTGGREKAPAAICRKVAEAKLRGQESGNPGPYPIDIWGDGTRTRSFMWIGDNIEGILKIMASDIREPINLGSSELVTINKLVDLVAEIAGVSVIKCHDLDKPQGVWGRNSDNTRILQELGWQPSTPLRRGLAETYAWIESQVQEDLKCQA